MIPGLSYVTPLCCHAWPGSFRRSQTLRLLLQALLGLPCPTDGDCILSQGLLSQWLSTPCMSPKLLANLGTLSLGPWRLGWTYVA